MDEEQIRRLPINESVRNAVVGLLGDYRIDRYSDKGANGYVFFATNRVLERHVAIKFYWWGGERKYHAEPRRLAAFACPHIAPVHTVGIADEEWAYFVTPYYADGDLDDLLGRGLPPLHTAIALTEDVVDGLSHLHAERFVHRDIKAENVFLEQGRAIIGDFGSVRRLPDAAESVPGSGLTLECWPPETCITKVYARGGDIYQAGLLFFRLLGGTVPPGNPALLNTKERREYDRLDGGADQSIYLNGVVRQRIARGKLFDVRTIAPWVPTTVRRAVRKAINLDPEKRFATTTEFLQHLQQMRRNTPEWTLEGESIIGFSHGGNRRRLLKDARTNLYRVERPRGSGWQRDGSIEPGSLEEVCSAVNTRYG